MDQLYVEIEINTHNSETIIYTSVPSFLALFTYHYVNEPQNIKVHFVATKITSGKVPLRSSHLRRQLTEEHIICKDAATLPAIRDLLLPLFECNGNVYIAGTCAVCREIISRQPNSELRKLLGFKASCLLAPAETSVWTRFCEVDLVNVVMQLHCNNQKTLLAVPEEIVRFEHHMNEPVRMHNIYKQAREQANYTVDGTKVKRKDRIVIECSSIPKDQLLIEHRFAEGVSFTVADLILYPLFRMFFMHYPQMLLSFPLTSSWLTEIDAFDPKCSKILRELLIPMLGCNNPNTNQPPLTIPDCKPSSLYKADPKRYRPRNRLFTCQTEVEEVLSKLTNLQLQFTADSQHTFGEQRINWHEIEPSHAKSSALPQERLERKRHQLENMTNAVILLAKPGYRIIDFCSGTGHLAILLALKLPRCPVVVMENKAYSLAYAQRRAADLKLDNCVFYQCNIDYFVGNFEIGTSLHACGTATDIVLQQCQRVNAGFVCCPCCYGSLQPMPHIMYPQSARLRDVLSTKDYLYIAHTADQAHEMGTTNCKPETTLQGLRCMCIVDTDRKLKAEESGYDVILTKLKPEQCTPKNHLLIGNYIGNNNCMLR